MAVAATELWASDSFCWRPYDDGRSSTFATATRRRPRTNRRRPTCVQHYIWDF